MNPTNQPQSTPMQGAMNQQQQPQQQTPSIDPQLSQSIIDNLKAQSQQVIKQQDQLTQSTDNPMSQQAGQMLQQKQMTLSRALGKLQPNSRSTQAQVGQANATGNYSYSGQCLRWVDDAQGKGSNRQPTAIADYQTNAQAGNISDKGTPPKGARVYFSSPTIPAGHVGISNGDGSFTSATDNGIQTFDINQWQKYAGQQYLGYASTNSK